MKIAIVGGEHVGRTCISHVHAVDTVKSDMIFDNSQISMTSAKLLSQNMQIIKSPILHKDIMSGKEQRRLRRKQQRNTL